MGTIIGMRIVLVDAQLLSGVPLVGIEQVQVGNVEALPVCIELLVDLGVGIVRAQGMDKGESDNQ